MTVRESFELIGIFPTTDQSQIKKAYAQKAKQYHPETHPEEWQRLHQAYKSALSYAKGQKPDSSMASDSVENWNHDLADGKKEEKAETDLYGTLFEQINDVADTELQKEKKELQGILDSLKCQKGRFGKADWERLFFSPAFPKCREDQETITTVLELVLRKRYYFEAFQLVYRCLIDLQNYLLDVGQKGLADSVQETLQTLEYRWGITEKNRKLLYGNRKDPRILGMNYRQIPLLIRIGGIFLVFLILYVVNREAASGCAILLLFISFSGDAYRKNSQKPEKPPKVSKKTRNRCMIVILTPILLFLLLMAAQVFFDRPKETQGSYLGTGSSYQDIISSYPEIQIDEVAGIPGQSVLLLNSEQCTVEPIFYGQPVKEFISQDPLESVSTYVFFRVTDRDGKQNYMVVDQGEQSELQNALQQYAEVMVFGEYETLSIEDYVPDMMMHGLESVLDWVKKESALWRRTSGMDEKQVFWVTSFLSLDTSQRETAAEQMSEPLDWETE